MPSCLGGYEFSRLVAQLLEKSGWKMELTQGSKGGGIDVVAAMEEGIQKQVQALKFY